MPRFALKNDCFPIYLLGIPINVCWNPQNMAHFSTKIDLRGHMPRFTLKINIFWSISLEPHKCGWNPQNRTWFSKTINLKVTCLGLLDKWTFSHLSPWKSHKCVLECSEQGQAIYLMCHMPRFPLKMIVFPIYLLGIPINVCWNPQNMAHFSTKIDLRGHMPRFTLKINIFWSISLEPHKCVLKPSEPGSFFQDDQFEGSHA